MRAAVAPLALVALMASAGCGAVDGTSEPGALGGSEASGAPGPVEDPLGTDGGVGLTSKERAELVLYASNQSFDNETVRMRITVDGTVVADQDFEVEGQHNWLAFPLDIEPGRHEIVVVADDGTTTRQEFTIRREGVRYAVVDYWNQGDDDSREITWLIQDEPLAFA